MVDAVSAAAAGLAFEPEELSGQPRHVERLGPTGIHEREEVEVEVALRPLSRAVLDAQLLERLCHLCATIAITRDVADAVRPEHLDELSHHALRIERWLHLADQIEEHTARGRVLVGDGGCEAIGAPRLGSVKATYGTSGSGGSSYRRLTIAASSASRAR